MTVDMLIVEDRPEEQERARETSLRAGYQDVTIVSDADAALEAIDKRPGAVLTDLFFPAGSRSAEYAAELVTSYEAFAERRFPRHEGGVVLAALEQCAEVFGMSTADYVDKVVANPDTPEVVLKAARDSIGGRKGFSEYRQFEQFVEQVRSGTLLASGIYISRAAEEGGIPCAIVTSTNHHDLAFEPVRELLHASYVDTLVDGKKDWDAGIRLLTR